MYENHNPYYLYDNSKIGIFLIARTNSKRLPRKAFAEILKRPSILHLVDRLKKSDKPLIACIPSGEQDNELNDLLVSNNVEVYRGDPDNPLKRMVECNHKYKFDYVVRVTHDDILIDIKIMKRMILYALKKDLDYCYTSLIPEGCGCEVFKTSALEKAYEDNKNYNIEGISAYFRNDSYLWDQYITNNEYQYQYRVTMDTPKDLALLRVLAEQLPQPLHSIQSLDIIHHLRRNPSLRDINKSSLVTIYIPNYNYANYIDDAIQSALNQTFQDIEIIVIDDASTDASDSIIKKYIYPGSRVNVIFNEKNIGLPACANKALNYSRSEYIMRIDADDVLMPECVEKLFKFLSANDDLGSVYAGYLETDEKLITIKEHLPPFDPDENTHHPTGCLIRRRCWEDLRYDSSLVAFESYDFFKRFNKRFDIGYFEEPLFFKRTHGKNMTLTDLEKREQERKKVDSKND